MATILKTMIIYEPHQKWNNMRNMKRPKKNGKKRKQLIIRGQNTIMKKRPLYYENDNTFGHQQNLTAVINVTKYEQRHFKLEQLK